MSTPKNPFREHRYDRFFCLAWKWIPIGPSKAISKPGGHPADAGFLEKRSRKVENKTHPFQTLGFVYSLRCLEKVPPKYSAKAKVKNIKNIT